MERSSGHARVALLVFVAGSLVFPLENNRFTLPALAALGSILVAFLVLLAWVRNGGRRRDSDPSPGRAGLLVDLAFWAVYTICLVGLSEVLYYLLILPLRI